MQRVIGGGQPRRAARVTCPQRAPVAESTGERVLTGPSRAQQGKVGMIDRTTIDELAYGRTMRPDDRADVLGLQVRKLKQTVTARDSTIKHLHLVVAKQREALAVAEQRLVAALHDPAVRRGEEVGKQVGQPTAAGRLQLTTERLPR